MTTHNCDNQPFCATCMEAVSTPPACERCGGPTVRDYQPRALGGPCEPTWTCYGCAIEASAFLDRLLVADAALQAAVAPLRDLGARATDQLDIHDAPLATIALGKLLGAHYAASNGSTKRDHVYDVVSIEFSRGRCARLFGKERKPVNAEEAALANDGKGIPGWCTNQKDVDAAQVALLK